MLRGKGCDRVGWRNSLGDARRVVIVILDQEKCVALQACVEWGGPRPADWTGPRETLSTRLPPDMVRQVRECARAQGVSVSAMVHRLLEASLEGGPVSVSAAHADLVTTLFD